MFITANASSKEVYVIVCVYNQLWIKVYVEWEISLGKVNDVCEWENVNKCLKYVEYKDNISLWDLNEELDNWIVISDNDVNICVSKGNSVICCWWVIMLAICVMNVFIWKIFSYWKNNI